MKKITEAELSNRVSSLREKLILEAELDAGKLNPDAKCKMCGNAYKDHFNFEPAGDPNGKVTSNKFRHLANPTNDVFPGLHEAPAAVATPVAPPTPIVGTDLPPLDPAAAVGQNGAGQSAPAFSPAASDAAFNQALARMNEPQADSAAKVSTPAAVPVDPRDGPTGQALARMGISKQNRLDQAFVDRMLGAGKYKAGSAESNLALLKTKPAGDTFTDKVPNQIGRAPPLGASPVQKDAKGQYWTTGNPPRLLTADEMKRYGLKESVTYADDQTLARIVSLGRR